MNWIRQCLHKSVLKFVWFVVWLADWSRRGDKWNDKYDSWSMKHVTWNGFGMSAEQWHRNVKKYAMHTKTESFPNGCQEWECNLFTRVVCYSGCPILAKCCPTSSQHGHNIVNYFWFPFIINCFLIFLFLATLSQHCHIFPKQPSSLGFPSC